LQQPLGLALVLAQLTAHDQAEPELGFTSLLEGIVVLSANSRREYATFASSAFAAIPVPARSS
jgi:hypothetical protein